MRDIAICLFILAAVFLAAGLMTSWKSASTPEISILVMLLCAGILAILGSIFLTMEGKK